MRTGMSEASPATADRHFPDDFGPLEYSGAMKGMRLALAVPLGCGLALGTPTDVPSGSPVDCLRPRSIAQKMSCFGVNPPSSAGNTVTTRRYCFRLAADAPELAFVVHFDREPTTGQLAVRKVEIYEPERDVPRETLLVEGDSFLPEDFDPLRLEDMNFDGLADLAVTVDMGATGNTQSVYWLYEPSKQRFVRVPELDSLPTLVPDPKTKRLRTHLRGGRLGAVYIRAEYRWHGRTLELVREESQDVDPRASDGDVFLRVIRERKGGKLREVAKRRLRYTPGGQEIPIP